MVRRLGRVTAGAVESGRALPCWWRGVMNSPRYGNGGSGERGGRRGAVYPGVRAAGGVDQAGERERRGGTFGRVSWSPVLLLLVVVCLPTCQLANLPTCQLANLPTCQLFDLLESWRGAAGGGTSWPR